MIDIEKAKRFYKKYISNYNPQEPRIALKITHIYRTAEKAKWLAQKLELNEEDVLLAELIGLLHDIGRFEQVKRHNTFVDGDSINHGEYGVKVLFKDGLIRRFVEDNQYDEIIKKAIYNHNRDKIDENIVDARELLHCKIIRDADKLDIFNVLLKEKLEVAYPLEKYAKEYVTPIIKSDFINQHRIQYAYRKTSADVLASHIAFVFDMNYLYSLMKVKENDYINKLIIRYGAEEEETKQDLEELKEVANQYIQEKIEEGEVCLKNY